MKVIFLDVDGVLNKFSDYEVLSDAGYFKLNRVLVNRLLDLIKKTDTKVVLSSSWRKLNGAREFLESVGISIYDVTDGNGRLRGDEIQRYIDAYAISDYVILDDDSDMLDSQKPWFVQTDPEFGLTETLAYRAAYKLGYRSVANFNDLG